MLDRAVFIDQSQSYTVYMSDVSVKNVIKHHMYTWSNGAKTGNF